MSFSLLSRPRFDTLPDRLYAMTPAADQDYCDRHPTSTPTQLLAHRRLTQSAFSTPNCGGWPAGSQGSQHRGEARYGVKFHKKNGPGSRVHSSRGREKARRSFHFGSKGEARNSQIPPCTRSGAELTTASRGLLSLHDLLKPPSITVTAVRLTSIWCRRGTIMKVPAFNFRAALMKRLKPGMSSISAQRRCRSSQHDPISPEQSVRRGRVLPLSQEISRQCSGNSVLWRTLRAG